jgi:lipopolysaccharide/colanic/teichoic acid biosynthesis glycosyltransferase
MDNGFIMPRGLPYFSAFDEWVKMYLANIDNWSLWLDLKILLKAIPAVFSGKRAS